jgi:5'-phosphate synthase pdxT subunit
MRTVGVLAVQGDFEAHGKALAQLGARVVWVKKPAQVAEVDALVLPGGESTTCLKFLAQDGFAAALREAAAQGKPMLGTCAGAILMAERVENPAQESLGLLDATVRRNAYGRQVDSFIAAGELLDPRLANGGATMEMVFIRAPQFVEIGRGVTVLARCQGQPVLVQQGRLLAGTFHPELTRDLRVHRYLLEMCAW